MFPILAAAIVGVAAAAPSSRTNVAVESAQPTPFQAECRFKAPDGTVYDFTELENPRADYAIVSDAPNGARYTYYYNFCRGTSARGSGRLACTAGKTSLCQNDPSAPPGENYAYSLGSVDQATWSELKIDGQVVGVKIKYLGGTDSRTSELEMMCNSDVETVVFTGVEQQPNNDRNFYTLRGESKFACKGSTPPIKCTHTSASGDTYDLSELQKKGPYKITVAENPGPPPLSFTHSIGICAPSSPCPNAQVPEDPASCATLETSAKLQYNDGTLASLKIEDLKGPFGIQGVLLTYTAKSSSQDQCQSRTNPRGERRTVIEVLCSATPVSPDPILKFVAEDPQCVYNFALESSEACPQSVGNATAML